MNVRHFDKVTNSKLENAFCDRERQNRTKPRLNFSSISLAKHIFKREWEANQTLLMMTTKGFTLIVAVDSQKLSRDLSSALRAYFTAGCRLGQTNCSWQIYQMTRVYCMFLSQNRTCCHLERTQWQSPIYIQYRTSQIIIKLFHFPKVFLNQPLFSLSLVHIESNIMKRMISFGESFINPMKKSSHMNLEIMIGSEPKCSHYNNFKNNCRIALKKHQRATWIVHWMR